MEFHIFGGRSIRIKGDVPLLYKFWCEVPVTTYFIWIFFQDSLYLAKLIRVGGYLPATVGRHCRYLMNVFTSGSVSSGQTYGPSIISSTYGYSPKAPISNHNQGLSSNGKYPLVWWYLFMFYDVITFSSGVLSLIFSMIPSVCCLVTNVVPDFLNLF